MNPFRPSRAMRIIALSVGIGTLLFAAGNAPAAAPQTGSQTGSPSTSQATFDREVRPLLRRLCYECHGVDRQEADVRLDTLDPDLVAGTDAEAWHDALNRINLGEMPPPKSPQPTDAERERIVGWLNAEFRRLATAERSTGGRTVMRRLTGYEYQNTMRDLLGVDLDYAGDLPPDPPSAEGFLNNGATLEISPLQLEFYLAAARRGLAEAIVVGDRPREYHVQVETSATGKLPRGTGGDQGPAEPEFIVDLKEFPRQGEFVVRLTAGAKLAADAPYPRLRVSLGFQPGIIHVPRKVLGEVDVTSTLDAPAVYEFRGRIEDFPQPGDVPFGNAAYEGMIVLVDFLDADGKNLPPIGVKSAVKTPISGGKALKASSDNFNKTYDVVVSSAEFQSPVHASWPPPSHTRILIPRDAGLDDRAYARRVVESFAERAWRRPPTSGDVDSLLGMYDLIRPRMPTFEETVREVLAGVLIAPEFLYLVERRTTDDGPEPLTDYELAARLSYFLWSTLPDEELRDAARRGTLRDPEALRHQVRRMLADPRAEHFSQQFAAQWFDLSALDRIAVNPQFHPDFDDRLKNDMRQETQQFFAAILRDDLSCLNLIDSDFAMLNRPLAKHYGLTGPRGTTFERVALKPDDRRGGVLTQGSFLLGGSNGESSHPIKRAVWILDRLLDDPPASPPPDVPELDPTRTDLAGLSLKQQLELHREKASCNSCHRGIDPWGVPLENFDAVGLWRTEVHGEKNAKAAPKAKAKKIAKTSATTSAPAASQGVPVDSRGELPDGTQVDGADELKRVLGEKRREQFARAVVRRLMSYALGRSLDFGDEPTVDRLAQAFLKSDLRPRPLIEEIVLSDRFTNK